MAEEAPRAPTKIVGRYALYGEIAAGGMATVHVGRLLGPSGFARTVAIKRLHPQFARDPEFVSMFLDEARLAARVQHPNVVATIDVVATEGELFLIMDYVRGEPLSRLVRIAAKHNERIPPRVCASIMCGFLHGLHAAHEAKNERGDLLSLIHRDVSPQNVLVGTDGVARVLDFGVAKAAGRVQVTRDGQIKGKLAYMPPEQLHGREISRQVDIYASAVVLWEALTAERLFKGENEADTLKKILRGVVQPPSQIVPGLHKSFDDVIMRGLGKVEGGYTTAREMAIALEKCVGIASPTEVGEWVERVAGDILAERESRIAEIESESTHLKGAEDSHSDISAPMPPQGLPLPIALPAPDSMKAPASSDHVFIGNAMHSASSDIIVYHEPLAASQRPPSLEPTASSSLVIPGTERTRTMMVAAIATTLLATFLAAGFAVGLLSRESEVTRVSAPSVSTPKVAAPPRPELEPEPIPETSTAPMVAPESSTLPAASVITVATAVQTPKPPSAAKKNAFGGPAGCEPPWEVDAKGHKKYKLECLSK